MIVTVPNENACVVLGMVLLCASERAHDVPCWRYGPPEDPQVVQQPVAPVDVPAEPLELVGDELQGFEPPSRSRPRYSRDPSMLSNGVR